MGWAPRRERTGTRPARKRECSGGAAILRAMDLGLQGKVALVTAASEGIGKHCALALAEEGAHVESHKLEGMELTLGVRRV